MARRGKFYLIYKDEKVLALIENTDEMTTSIIKVSQNFELDNKLHLVV